MLRRAIVVASLTAAAVPMVFAGTAAAAPGDCAVIDGTGRCLVAAADPGRPGGPQDKARPPKRAATPPSVRAPAPPVPQAPTLPRDVPIGQPVFDGGRTGVLQLQTPNGIVGPAAPLVGQVLAQRAVEQLTLRPPSIHTSAQASGFVGVPVWLWIDRGVQFTGPVSATATAGNASVTATGRLVGVEWSMGPPGAMVHCSGPGTPWTGQRGASPDCGYIYSARSLPERTGGTGRWTITATSLWQVTWTGVSGGAPVNGVQGVQVAAQATMPVGEVQVLVDGGGG